MKAVEETYLPCIEKKFLLNAHSGDQIVIIVHNDGRREVYHYYREDPG